MEITTIYGEINRPGLDKIFALTQHWLSGVVAHTRGVELYASRARAGASALNIVMAKVPEVAETLRKRVDIVQMDVENMISWQGITHVYMYDLGFKRHTWVQILRLWVTSTSTRWLVSYRTPKVLWQRGFDLKLLCSFYVKQQGKGAYGHNVLHL